MRLLLKSFVQSHIFCFICFYAIAQCPQAGAIDAQAQALEHNQNLSYYQKLESFYKLKKIAEDCLIVHDSAYAYILLKMGKYEAYLNNNYTTAINYTQIALQVNNSSKKKFSKYLAINSSYNIGTYFQNLGFNNRALNYYDTTILLCNSIVDTNEFVLDSRYNKTGIYFLQGDYQLVVDESIKGMNLSLQENNLSKYLYFLNQKVQAFSYQNYLQKALHDIRSAISLAEKLNDNYEKATAYKTFGFIYEKQMLFDSAEFYYKQAIRIRLVTNEYAQIASDYNDFGNFYLNSRKDYKNAQENYNKAVIYANKIPYPIDRSLKLALVYLNLGENNLVQKKLNEAQVFFLKSFESLHVNLAGSLQNNPSFIQVSSTPNKDYIIALLIDKVQILLDQYKLTAKKQFLYSAINSAMLTDSIIAQTRHEQLSEISKLYWRNKTRIFFTTVMECCLLADDKQLAFYFMEKSRAVLLNDKLNELNASSYLSKSDAAQQEYYEIKIVELEQRLSALSDTSKPYQNIQQQYLAVKTDFDQYIKSLEQKYPAYYQYKYADKVPSLKDLQNYLAKNNQCFIHYFSGDTVTYILAIAPPGTKFIQLTQKDFNKDELAEFLQMCANKQTLMNNYNGFAQLSNSIYKKIFQQLQLPKGRVIICADAIVIPFETLCTDENGRNFLLNDYSFSYVYSARFLMKQFNNPAAKGNFIGFAPVSFEKYLGVQDLKNAANALQASAAYYKNDKLFAHTNATRSNFFNYASSYSVVSIFSHARADTTDNEPVLFMHDSMIYLSELQRLNNPATKLVLLSACQTNVGKTATGEGIYSLARGFATAGIPCVSATLWKADEQTIYIISEKFNQYLSEGMHKDEALQKAKLYFMRNNSNNDKLLPYYWANMILIGNADKIHFTTSKNNYWWWIAAGLLIIVAISLLYIKQKGHKS